MPLLYISKNGYVYSRLKKSLKNEFFGDFLITSLLLPLLYRRLAIPL